MFDDRFQPVEAMLYSSTAFVMIATAIYDLFFFAR
jgi:hypothetical protein